MIQVLIYNGQSDEPSGSGFKPVPRTKGHKGPCNSDKQYFVQHNGCR